MAIEHSAIVDPNQHEPKGIGSATAGQVYVAAGGSTGAWGSSEPPGTSAATAGQVYIADGAGGGAWGVGVPQPHGWMYYKDGDAAQTFSTTPAILTLDGATTQLNGYKPSGVTELWDVTNDKLTPAAVGDSYVVRLDLPITNRTGSPNKMTIQIDIGGLPTVSNSILTEEVIVTGTAPYNMSVTMSIFCLSTFLANGGKFFLNVDTGSVDVTEPAVLITRTSGTIL